MIGSVVGNKSLYIFRHTKKEKERAQAVTWKESPVKSVQFLEARTNVPFIHGQPKGPPVSGIGWPLFRGRPDQGLSQYFPAQGIPLSAVWSGTELKPQQTLSREAAFPCRKNVSQLHVLLVTNLETRRPVITWKQEQCPSLFSLSLSKFSWNSAEKQAYVFGRVFLDICDSQRDYITNHTQIILPFIILRKQIFDTKVSSTSLTHSSERASALK